MEPTHPIDAHGIEAALAEIHSNLHRLALTEPGDLDPEALGRADALAAISEFIADAFPDLHAHPSLAPLWRLRRELSDAIAHRAMHSDERRAMLQDTKMRCWIIASVQYLIANGTGAEEARRTVSNALRGTPSKASPEQIRKYEAVWLVNQPQPADVDHLADATPAQTIAELLALFREFRRGQAIKPFLRKQLQGQAQRLVNICHKGQLNR